MSSCCGYSPVANVLLKMKYKRLGVTIFLQYQVLYNFFEFPTLNISMNIIFKIEQRSRSPAFWYCLWKEVLCRRCSTWVELHGL